MTDRSRDAAGEIAELFPAIYLRFHRRDEPRAGLTNATHSVLTHLSMSGPITVGEAAKHLRRAQSVVSEIFDQLEAHGYIERVRDPDDQRRTLVWLTDAGIAALAHDREVLSRELLEAAMSRMTAAEREALLAGARALIRANADVPKPPTRKTKR